MCLVGRAPSNRCIKELVGVIRGESAYRNPQVLVAFSMQPRPQAVPHSLHSDDAKVECAWGIKALLSSAL
jgi:hypothetical protein